MRKFSILGMDMKDMSQIVEYSIFMNVHQMMCALAEHSDQDLKPALQQLKTMINRKVLVINQQNHKRFTAKQFDGPFDQESMIPQGPIHIDLVLSMKSERGESYV